MSSWKEATAPDGRTYYWLPGTSKTQWDKPADFDAEATPATPATPQNSSAHDGAWREATAADGRTYYWNTATSETTWTAPEGFLSQKQNARPNGPAFVAGGAQNYGNDDYGGSDRRRGDRDQGLPQKPSFDSGRGGGMPWEQRHDNAGFRGPMPVKTDEPEYATYEQAEDAFFKMLRKHSISPDTTWEEALRTIVKDREYRALKDPKERRQVFEKYCQDVRAQEKGKEKERRERTREEFRKMLTTHDEIKHYTRWKTARSIIEREAVFRSAGDDDERRQMFDSYILELKKKHAEDEATKRRSAYQDVEAMLQALIVDPNTKWSDAQDQIMENERFKSDPKFRTLPLVEIFMAFDGHMKALDRVANDTKQREKRLHTRRERQARDNYRQLLHQMLSQGKIRAGTKWKDFYPHIAEDERYLNLIGTPGSSPLDLFWDVVEEEERKLRTLRNDALDVLEDRRYEMSISTTLGDFSGVMQSDSRTAKITDQQMSIVYEKLMDKIRKRAEKDKNKREDAQRAAIDALRNVIKRLDPPVHLSDTYVDVVPRLQGYPEFEDLDEEYRKSAFEKHMRRLKDSEASERRPRDRDRDRDNRDGSRRDQERRHHTRTPEFDAYEADRRKAQADRERQYRKPSFGFSPSRDHRDGRDDRYRRPDRRESMSIYDRERREREMERERSYISRADPRDKGRTLDYGDEDAVGSRPGSIRKRRESDGSTGGRRDIKVSLSNEKSFVKGADILAASSPWSHSRSGADSQG